MESYVGEIRLFGGNYAPQGWALCNGQVLPINSYAALYSVIGARFGGDGRNTFALPDLRGRTPIHWGAAATGTTYNIAQTGGVENVALTVNQMPQHTHPIQASSGTANATTPQNNFMGVYVDTALTPVDVYATAPNTIMNPAAAVPAGGNQPHTNMQPFMCVTYIICLTGYFPSPS